jgi:CDP-diacylglycerol--glycerol-3-phosphate 3-phosphatidyltransferase
MANLITLVRLILLFVLVALVYRAAPEWQVVNAPLLLFIIALDGLDGYVARKRREATVFGSIFDITVDRVVEYVLWVVLAHVDLVPIWAALVFIVRGTIVDSIRYAAIAEGETAFGMMRTPLGHALVAGRFMRGFYGTLKAVTFAWVLALPPWQALFPASWESFAGGAEAITVALVHASVLVCLVRGVPVVVELVNAKQVFHRHPSVE